jgi:glucokinase
MDCEMVIGVDLGGTHMRTALVDEAGNIVRRRKTATSISFGARQTARRLLEVCRTEMDAAKELGGTVIGIGLGVAGKVDHQRGWVVFSPNLPSMRNYPLGPELENNLDIPVLLENDANVFGIGESWVGAGREIENWVGLTLGTGVGGCLILDGKLWNGDNLGFVAEIGHMIVHPEGPQCTCGLNGCLEAHASARALLEFVNEAASSGQLNNGTVYELWKDGKLNAQDIYRCSVAGDQAAREAFARMGWALGLALANLFTVLGIRNTIIGGGVSAGWDQFIGPLGRSLAQHSSMLVVEEAVVQRSVLGDDAALFGAARLAIEHYTLPSI